MSVRAKFKVTRIEATEGSKRGPDVDGKPYYLPCEMRTIVMAPVYANNDPDHENFKFWNASPSGEIKLGVVNEQAWPYFELGQEYYIDFTRVKSMR